MSRLGWFESLVLVAFFFSGLAAFLIGGMVWVGYVAQAFMVTTGIWVARAIFLLVKDDLIEEWRRYQAFKYVRKRNELKGSTNTKGAV